MAEEGNVLVDWTGEKAGDEPQRNLYILTKFRSYFSASMFPYFENAFSVSPVQLKPIMKTDSLPRNSQQVFVGTPTMCYALL